MSASTEFYHSDNYVAIKIDIEDCPVVEFPLTELFDIATSTIVDNYLEVLQEYVTQILEDTTWLDKQSKLCLLRARFCIYQRKNDGTLYTLRQSALQRLITQTLRSGFGIHRPIEVPLFVRLRSPDIEVPRKTRFPVTLALDSNVHSGLRCSTSPNRSFAAYNEMLSSIIPDGVVAKGLNESTNASALDEESQAAVDHIPHVVKKDTNDHEPQGTISITLDFDVMPSGGNDFVYDFGLDTVFKNKDQNIDDLGDDDLADVVRMDNTATVTTVTDVSGPSPIMSTMVHRNASTNVLHHPEELAMSPKGMTAHKQYQLALAVIAHQHGVLLPSELMRYHPIDRGRNCISAPLNSICLVS